MGFDGMRAFGGLLGELGRQQDAAAVRQQELEDKRLEELRENRRIEAQLAKQQALAKYEYDLNQSGTIVGVDSNGLPVTRGDMGSGAKAMSKEAYERTLGMTEEQRAEHDAKMGLLNVQLENAKAAGKAKEDTRGTTGKDYDDLARIFGPEQAASMVGSKYGKKEVSDYQRIQALDKVQAIIDASGGIVDDRNAPQINAMLRSIGEPGYERVEETPAKDGWFKDTPATYKWVPSAKVEDDGNGGASKGNVDYNRLYTSLGKAESGNRSFQGDGSPVVSPKGAKYEMQVMDRTAGDPGFGIKPAQTTGDPRKDAAEYNRVGRDYIKALVEKYQGNVPAAIAAYNMGPGAFDEWAKNGADVSRMPEETRNHVRKVLEDYGMMAPTENGEGLLAGGQQQGQPPQKAKPEKKQIDLSQFDLAKQQKKGPVQMDEPARVDIGVPTADAKQQTDDPLLEQLGRGARVVVYSAKNGANAVGGGLLAARDFGESFGTGERWAKIFAGLSSGAKVTWQKMKESGIPEEQIVEAASKNSMTVEEYLAQFAKGYSSTKGNGKS